MEDDQTAAQQIRSSTDDFLTVLRGSHAILYDDESESVVPLNPFHEYWPDPNDEVKSKPK